MLFILLLTSITFYDFKSIWEALLKVKTEEREGKRWEILRKNGLKRGVLGKKTIFDDYGKQKNIIFS